jgi:amidase
MHQSLIARGDGCPDVYDAVQLSGEPFVPEITNLFPNGKPRAPLPLPEYQQVISRMKDYRQRYLDYWTSTAERTGGKSFFSEIQKRRSSPE